MAETLYPAGAQLLEGAAQTATAQSGQQVEREKIAATQEQSQQKNMVDLVNSHLDRQANQVTITPQIALGLVKNTGDKSWLEAVGQPMRADVMLGLYQYGMRVKNSKYTPKITDTYTKDGKVQKALAWVDPDTEQPMMYTLGEGMSPEKLHPGKGKGSGAGADDDFKKKKTFIHEYEKRRMEYSDPIKAQEAQKTNPEKYEEDIQWLKDNRDDYDSAIKMMSGRGTGGAAPAAGGSGGSGGGSSAPFDADSFIKDALGQ